MAKQVKVVDRKLVAVIGLHLLAFLTAIRIVNPLVKSSVHMHYYLHDGYKNSLELFLALGRGDVFKWCCDCILYYARVLGLSYEQLNIDLFVILEPLMISCLLTLFVLQSSKLKVCSNRR
jgi:hypothetical protein